MIMYLRMVSQYKTLLFSYSLFAIGTTVPWTSKDATIL